MWFFLVLGWIIPLVTFGLAKKKWESHDFDKLLNNVAASFGGLYFLALILSGVVSLVLIGFKVLDFKPHPDPIVHLMMAFITCILTNWIAKFRFKELPRSNLLIIILISQVSIYTLLVVLHTLF